MMIITIVNGKQEGEADTLKVTLAKVRAYLQGLKGDATVRIVIEPRVSGKGAK